MMSQSMNDVKVEDSFIIDKKLSEDAEAIYRAELLEKLSGHESQLKGKLEQPPVGVNGEKYRHRQKKLLEATGMAKELVETLWDLKHLDD